MFWAIRVKGTNKFLPATKRGRGFTCDEPRDATEFPPRMFKKHGAAVQAMNYWKGGTLGQVFNDTDQRWEVKYLPGTTRKDILMEVVPVYIFAEVS